MQVEETFNQQKVTRQPQQGGFGETFCTCELGRDSEKVRAQKLRHRAVLKDNGLTSLTTRNAAQHNSLLMCHLAQKERAFGQDLGSLKEDTLSINTTVRPRPTSTLLPNTKPTHSKVEKPTPFKEKRLH